MIEMNVQRGNDGVEVIVLQLGQGLLHMRLVMIVNEGDAACRLDIRKFPLVLYEGVGNHAGNSEGTIVVAFFADHSVQLPKQCFVHGNTDSCDGFFSHDAIYYTTSGGPVNSACWSGEGDREMPQVH